MSIREFNLSKILRPGTIATPHAEDLAKSQISIEAAMAAGVATVPPNFIGKVLALCNYGWAADKVNSLLAFRYPPLNGNGDHEYFRVKVFPPIEIKGKRAAKYLQPQGSSNHVYIPPGVDPKSNNPLYITEGEKKSYCLTLNGFPCIGLGGVYGWKRDGGPIDDLDVIKWENRDVIIVFDADAAVNDGVVKAEKALAEELLSRKANVFIKRLPYGPGCANGADDFILAHSAEQFKKLKIKAVKPKKAKGTSDPTMAAGVPVNLVDELNREHAVAMIGGKCAVLNIDQDHDISFSSVNDFKNFMANQRVFVQANKGTKSVSIGQVWMEHPDRREYPRGVAFSPGTDTPGAYNLWRGFAEKPEPGDCSLYYSHLEHNICSGNEAHFKYLLDWLARNVQDPGGERPGVAVVLKSPEFGTGKGVAATQFGMIFGPHFRHITNGLQIVGRFNSHLKECVLCFVDEGVWGGDKQAAGVLRGLITETKMMIEPKGIQAFPVDNHMSFIIASNNEWVVPAGFDDRRFFVLDVSPAHKQDTDYFGALVDQMNSGGRAALLHDLLERKITVNLRKVPRTSALFDQVINGMATVHKFWFELLRSMDAHQWPEYFITDKLYQEYLVFADACGDRHPLIDSQFGKQLRTLFPPLKRARKVIGYDRPMVYFVGKLNVCRSFFNEAVGADVDWGTDE